MIGAACGLAGCQAASGSPSRKGGAVRRLLIGNVLPLIFCLIPVLAALLVVVAVPGEARRFYLAQISESHIDWIILGLGLTLFTVQTLLAWRALQWRGTAFNE